MTSGLRRAFSFLFIVSLLMCGVAGGGVNEATGQPQKKARRHTALRRISKAPNVRRPAKRLRPPDVIYYPTPTETVIEMLRVANIQSDDVLYDLGSGDGRIPIVAAQRYGIRAVGIDITPNLVWVAKERARALGVSNRVRFINADMFRSNISEATIVTLYLSTKLNLLLRPKLLRELRPGTRIISHDFDMGDWEPEQTVRVPWLGGHRTVYLWTVPDTANSRYKGKPKRAG